MKKLIGLLAGVVNFAILLFFLLHLFGCPNDDAENVAGQADFTPMNKKILVGDEVMFEDQSTGDIDTYEWEFENGNPPTSTIPSPVVTFNEVGTSNVTLTVTDLDGNKTVKTGTIEVLDVVKAEFTADMTTVDKNGEVLFTATPTGNPTDILWELEGAEPSSSNELTVIAKYALPGPWDVSLTVSHELSTDTKTETDFITVNPEFTCYITGSTGTDGTSTTSVFDNDFNLQQLIEEFEAELQFLFQYTYDGEGNLTRIDKFDASSTLESTETFDYNDVNLVSRYSAFDDNGTARFFSDYFYEDESDNPASSITQQSDGQGGFLAFDVVYEFDGNNNLSSESFGFFGTEVPAFRREYQHDDMKNHFTELGVLPPPGGNNPNNIIKTTTFDAQGNIVEEINFEFTYNMYKYPETMTRINFDQSSVTFTYAYECVEDQ